MESAEISSANATEMIDNGQKLARTVAFSEETIDNDKANEMSSDNGKNDDGQELKQQSKDAAASDDVSSMLKGMKKKKKNPKPVEDEKGTILEDGGLDLSGLRKKKKSKKPKENSEDDFASKIAALQLAGKDDDITAAGSNYTPEIFEGDMDKGTGLWKHDSEIKIPYDKLLSRFFILLAQKNPDHFSSGSKSYKIPPPQCLREGNKKTIFANIAEICKRMKRTDEHVTSYLFAELGTSGSVDGSRRLVIKGRFQQKQIENVLRRYIMEYVTCKTCRSPATELNKGENRLYFITCNSCGSRRSVTAIKTGFSAQVGKRRRQQG